MYRSYFSIDLQLSRVHASNRKILPHDNVSDPPPKSTKKKKDQGLSRTRSGMKPNEEDISPPSLNTVAPSEEIIPQNTQDSIVSGEWINSHTFVCCSCGSAFYDLADIMDHKWMAHPGVWCAHTMIQGHNPVPESFSRQYLPAESQPVEYPPVEEKLSCSRCKIDFSDVEDFHMHLIECGGLSLLRSSKKRNKKALAR